ncbi:MAG TPA: LysR substrate-binding domain-containing protein [Pseudolysinimonas sp.]|nr:LysR family transcriptional regulator [Schumannella sp.]HEV7742384.1 LysR substrate-binding domain-containing protein [Pseudolysinimonas sp.]
MFDPALLRTFVAVAETLSFTRAAELLQLSQPTVSQQIRKLEVAANRVLVARDTRAVALTDNGDAMLGFARSILAAHDEAAAYFTGSAMRGRLRFGSADDLALTQLPQILRDFRQLYPQINLELTVSQSGVLARRLKAGQLDLVFIKQEPDLSDGRVVRRERLVWVAHKSLQLDPSAHVPLIVYAAPSLSRDAAIKALEDAGRTWRITCNVKELNGALAALRAGIGVAVFPQNMIPPDLVPVTNAFGLPMLGEVDFALLDNPRAAREPVEALIGAIVGRGVTPAGG